MLRPQPLSPVPADTARVAKTLFPDGHPYLRLADELGDLLRDELFAPLFPALGQPALAPWRLALVTIPARSRPVGLPRHAPARRPPAAGVAALPDTRCPHPDGGALLAWLLVTVGLAASFVLGANDVSNAVGIWTAVHVASVPVAGLAGGLAMGVGALTWGQRILNRVAFDIVRMDWVMASAAQGVQALVVFLAVTQGLFTSMNQALVGAMAGTGLARGRQAVRRCCGAGRAGSSRQCHPISQRSTHRPRARPCTPPSCPPRGAAASGESPDACAACCPYAAR